MKTEAEYPSEKTKDLYQAVLSLKSLKEATAFFRDLLTLPEIEDLTQRFQIAKRLYQGKSYAATAKELEVSTTTVSRVAHWLFRGRGGYKQILRRLYPKK
jgi:TrpR-related protein YerC/YecD